MPRIISWTLEIDWDRDGSWIDESSRLVNASGSWSFAAPGQSFVTGRGYISQANFTLDNKDSRYSPLYTSSPLVNGTTASIGYGAGYHANVRFKVSIDGGSTDDWVFTGVAKIPSENGPTPKQTATVTLDCRGKEESILNKRISTTRADMASWHDNGVTEDELFRETLIDAGLADGTDFVSPYYYDNVSSTNPITIDRGRFKIPFYWLDDESPVEEMWQLANACGGRFYAGPDGKFYYEAIDHWLYAPHTTLQETFDANDYESIRAYYDDNDLWSEVVVEASPRVLDSTTVLWQPDEIHQIPAGQTKTITARLRQPGYSINTPTYTATTAGGSVMTGDVDLTATYYAQRVEMEFENTNAVHAAQLRHLSITGEPVIGGPTVEERKQSANSYWTGRVGRTRAIRGSVYVQTRTHAALVADYLCDRLERPALFYEMRGVPGDPTRRLGDYVTISDPDVMPSNARTAYLTGITWRLSNRGFVQDIDAIDAAYVFQYDASDYFIIGPAGVGDVMGTTPSNARIFY